MSRYVMGSVAPSVEITRTNEVRSTQRLARRPGSWSGQALRAGRQGRWPRFPRDKANRRGLRHRLGTPGVADSGDRVRGATC